MTIPVNVPEHLLPEVYRFIADRLDAEQATPETSEPSVGTGDRKAAAWPLDKFTRLASTHTRGLDTIHRVLDLLAAKPGEPKTTTDLVNAFGVERNHLRAALAGLTRHLKSHYGHDTWPLAAEWDGSEFKYSMSPEMAARWQQARAATT